nr:HAMP domain-containing sensor histidine kinase [Nocardioides flavescens]
MEVFAADGTPVAGSVEPELRAAAADLSTVTRAQQRSGPSDEVQLLATPFATASGERGVLVVSQDSAPYERSEFYALLATVALGLIVVVGAAVVSLRVTRQALAPVRQMAERAADWSEHDLSHRFALGPPDNELAALGETLDHLLDRVASAIRSEQRLTAELAHELRTPLTSVRGSAELALLRGIDDPELRADVEQIHVSSREMSEVVSTLLDLARSGSARTGDGTCLVADVVARATRDLPPGATVETSVETSTARVAAPADLVVRALSPLLANAVRHAATSVRVSATDRPAEVVLTVADDGPGVAAQVRDTLFEPGVTHGSGGAGLGLGIAQRVARSCGGEIVLVQSHEGAAFELHLPRR